MEIFDPSKQLISLPILLSRAREQAVTSRLSHCLLFAFFFLRLAAFLLRLKALFLAFGPFRRALHEFRTDQFQHRQFRAVALAGSEARDASVAAGPLSETRTERFKQLLYRGRRHQKRCGLPPRVERVFLGEIDHLLHHRRDCFRLGNRGDDALLQDHAGREVLEKAVARPHVPFEFYIAKSMSHLPEPSVNYVYCSSSGMSS